MAIATEEQKAELEQVEKGLEEIIELTQTSLLSLVKEDDRVDAPAENNESSIEVIQSCKLIWVGSIQIFSLQIRMSSQHWKE